MSEKTADPADLGALIETYRPIDKRGCLRSIGIAVVSYLVYFLLIWAGLSLLAPLMLRKTGPGIELSAIISGMLVGLTILPSLSSVSRAHRHRFKIEIYEKGFAVSRKGKTALYFWRDVVKMELSGPQDNAEALLVEFQDQTNYRFLNGDLMQFSACSKQLIKGWQKFHGRLPPPQEPFPSLEEWLRRLTGKP